MSAWYKKFPYPPEVNGVSYLKSQNYRLKRSKFPYPPELNGVSKAFGKIKPKTARFPSPHEVNGGSYKQSY